MNRLHSRLRHNTLNSQAERGAVLFFVLIALVVLMLAATALIRTVDTASVISGNLVFRQAARSSGDLGLEKAIDWINTSKPGNNDLPASGYYSNMDPTKDLFADSTWASNSSGDAGIDDDSGNQVRYIVERVCRNGGVPITDPLADCLFADQPTNTGSRGVGSQGSGAPAQKVLYRVTVKISGPRNTVSYVQGFVY